MYRVVALRPESEGRANPANCLISVTQRKREEGHWHHHGWRHCARSEKGVHRIGQNSPIQEHQYQEQQTDDHRAYTLGDSGGEITPRIGRETVNVQAAATILADTAVGSDSYVLASTTRLPS